MKRSRIYFILLFVLILLVVIKWFFLKNPSGQKPSFPSKGVNSPFEVTAYIAKTEKWTDKLFISGTIIPNEEVEIVPEISGKITSLFINEGKEVSKGDLLVKINDTDYQIQLKKLKIQEELFAGKEIRMNKLLQINGTSKEEYENTLNQLNLIRADIEMIKSQIIKTEIKAPFTGFISFKNVSEGAYISPTTIITNLVQVDPVKIDFSIPEKYAYFLTIGQPITFSIEGIPGKFEAKIVTANPMIDVSSRTLKVRAVCSNKNNKIKPGAFAKIELTINESEKNILLPTEGLLPVLKGYKVFVYRSGKTEEIPVKTGLRTEKQIQITDGLQPGDTVITTGLMKLKSGTAVKIISIH